MERPTIIIQGFDTTYERSFDESGKPTGRKDRAVDWVTYAPAHMPLLQSTRERVGFLDPANMKIRGDDENGAKKADFMRWRWAQIEPAYNAWKKGHELPVNGTPLAAWPGLNAAQAAVFRALGIQSVEQIAGMNDALMGRVQLPGVREIKASATAFLEARGDAEFADRVTRVEQHNRELTEKLEAAMELLGQQAAAANAAPKKQRQKEAA